jgi:CPA1 family monovalent cation:H+ antiporter
VLDVRRTILRNARMTTLDLAALLLVLAAVFGYINAKLLHLPRTIAILILALAVSLVLIGAEHIFPEFQGKARLGRILESAHLSEALLDGALSFLLFAGAIEVSFTSLWDRKWTILALATLGVVISAGLMGTAMWYVFQWVGHPVPFIWCLVFGAVVAPTDPVAVLGALQRAGLPAPLQATIAGESLFNDGVGVVVFTLLVGIATGTGDNVTAGGIFGVFLWEAVGGAVLGLVAGYITYLAMRFIDDHNVELMISLALVTATYAIALNFHLSGPVAVVVAGILIGSRGRERAMSEKTRNHLDIVWSVIDEILNALLFLLIGLEILVIEATIPLLVAAVGAALLSLAIRFTSVLPMRLLPARYRMSWSAIGVLTWAGLRGGISIALALSLPAMPYREAILAACYGVVLFTILVQGLTLETVASRLSRGNPERG